MAKKQVAKKAKRKVRAKPTKKCGLCGNSDRLVKTDCCNQWICDDEHEYEMFSYARNSCARNHDRYTLCGFHYNEQHDCDDWRDCENCLAEIEPEMYAYYGTNEYNFVVLENPPDYEPTKCCKCKSVIVLSEGGYSHGSDGYTCGNCLDIDLSKFGM